MESSKNLNNVNSNLWKVVGDYLQPKEIANTSMTTSKISNVMQNIVQQCKVKENFYKKLECKIEGNTLTINNLQGINEINNIIIFNCESVLIDGNCQWFGRNGMSQEYFLANEVIPCLEKVNRFFKPSCEIFLENSFELCGELIDYSDRPIFYYGKINRSKLSSCRSQDLI